MPPIVRTCGTVPQGCVGDPPFPMTRLIHLADYRRRPAPRVYFNRGELSQLLSVYAARVARGDWRDYAIDHAADAAFFSVFRRTHEQPLLCVAKLAPRGGRPTEYLLTVGRVPMRRARQLGEVLRVIDGIGRELRS